MIGTLQGTVAARQPPWLVVEVGGVGYELEAPMSTFYVLPPVGERVMLYTHLVVRDDAHLLFGFATESERSLFRGLLKVSGVGARVALAVLSGISVDGFVQCIRDGNSAALTRVPGIGKKTAERLVMEMRDRFAAGVPAGDVSLTGAAAQAPREEAYSALVALGYKPQEATRMLAGVDDTANSEDMIRRALQGLVKRGDVRN